MSMPRVPHRWLTNVAPWLFVVLWSTGFIAAKFALRHAPPFKLLFLRGALSCAMFMALAGITGARFPTARLAWRQFKVGLLLQGAFLGGCFFAISHGMPAGWVALITGTQPVLTAIHAAVSQGERISAAKWLGISMGFAGVCLVLMPNTHGQSFGWIGLLGAVVGLLGITAGSIAQNRARDDGVDLLTSAVWQYVALTVLAAAMSWFTETAPVDWSLSLIAGLMWLVVGVSTAAMLLLLFMLKGGEATKVSTYFYLVPVITTLQAWALFDEPLQPSILLGMAITVLGMLLFLKAPSALPH